MTEDRLLIEELSATSGSPDFLRLIAESLFGKSACEVAKVAFV